MKSPVLFISIEEGIRPVPIPAQTNSTGNGGDHTNAQAFQKMTGAYTGLGYSLSTLGLLVHSWGRGICGKIQGMNNQVIVTDELLMAGASDRGGWNRRQINALGIHWPLTNGWKSRVIGTIIERKNAAAFLMLKGATKRPAKVKGNKLIRTDLPFAPTTGETEKRVVDSFWRWLSAQPEETRRALSQPLTWMVRRHNADLAGMP